MNNPESNDLTIEKYRHDLEVVRNTAAQIIKDFNLFGIEITFSGNEFSAYEELKKQIIPALKNLYKDNHAAFFSLLYRIDVDENKVQQVLNNSQGDEMLEQLSKFVIEREFTKAVFKKLYRGS